MILKGFWGFGEQYVTFGYFTRSVSIAGLSFAKVKSPRFAKNVRDEAAVAELAVPDMNNCGMYSMQSRPFVKRYKGVYL
jgi:hypothetical protein